MTNPNGMPDNPGDPENTDPEATSADFAERAAEESAARQVDDPEAGDDDAGVEPEIDPALEAEIDEALADIDPDADGDGAVSSVEEQLAERTEDLQRVSAEYANYRRRTDRERGHHKVERRSVSEILGPRSALLHLPHKVDHLGEVGLRTCLLDFDDDRTLAIGCPSDDPVSRPLLHRR